MSQKTPIFVPRGNSLTLTTDAFSAGIYVRQSNPGEEPDEPTAIAASEEVVLGPFNEPRNYLVDVDGNEIGYVLAYSGIFTGSDEISGATLTAAEIDAADLVLIQDDSDGNLLKVVTAQSIADLVVDSVTAAALQSDIDDAQADATQALGDASDANDNANLRVPIINVTHVGAANTGSTAVESGDAHNHTTVLTVSSVLPAIAGGADLSVGKLLYTFPAGAIVVNSAYMSMAITQTESNIDADTPDIGLGTTIAAGANALLSDTSGAENILTGQTANDCSGTAEVKTVANQVLVIEAGGDHTVYFNAADGWAADGDAAAIIAGTVVLNWQFMA